MNRRARDNLERSSVMDETYAYGAETGGAGYDVPLVRNVGQAIGGNWGGIGQVPTFVGDPPPNPCRVNQHFFACKHEKICTCGRTSRLGYEMEEGL
jgi:hypothetical protein